MWMTSNTTSKGLKYHSKDIHEDGKGIGEIESERKSKRAGLGINQ